MRQVWRELACQIRGAPAGVLPQWSLNWGLDRQGERRREVVLEQREGERRSRGTSGAPPPRLGPFKLPPSLGPPPPATVSISARLQAAPSRPRLRPARGPDSSLGTPSQRDGKHVIGKVRPPGLRPAHVPPALQCPPAPGRAPRPAPAGRAPLAPPPPPPLPPVGHRHPPAPGRRRPGLVGGGAARPLLLRHAPAAPAPRPARPRRRGPPARLCHPAPHAPRSVPAGDALRGPPAPAAARRRRPAPAGARAPRPGPRLRGAHARGDGGHAAAGGLRGARLPPAAAALHRVRAGVPGGHALRRRDPRGRGRGLHAPAAAPGPGAGPAGAQAPPARLHAHRSADHHLLLLAHRHHRHLQSRAGAHGLGPRRHGVRRDRFPRSPELLLHLPGGGHRSHGAVHHPHRGHHHRRATPRELLGPLRGPPARPRAAPLELGAPCTPAPGAAGRPPTLSAVSTEPLVLRARSRPSGSPPKPTALGAPLPASPCDQCPPARSPAPEAPPPARPRPALTKPRLQVGRLRLLLVWAG